MFQTQKFENSLNFFNVKISVTVTPKHLIFSLTILYITRGGRVSQIFVFMSYFLKKMSKSFHFLSSNKH